MIRSSRIPLLLDKICTDGIISSLLISKDGELLGSSTTSANKDAAAGATPENPNSEGATTALNSNAFPTDHCNNEISISSSPLPSQLAVAPANLLLSSSIPPPPPAWTKMNPSDIGAIIAEVVQDYKRLGCELALLDPSSLPCINMGTNTSTSSSSSTVVASNTNSSKNEAMGNNISQQHQPQQLQNKQADGSVVGDGGGGTTKIKEDGSGQSSRDRGRLNCLIMEFEMVSLYLFGEIRNKRN